MSGIPHPNKDSSKGVFVDASCITPLPSSQLINSYGINHDPHCIDNIIRDKKSNSDYWHRFTICNETYSCSEYPKNFILKVITDFVYPCDLLPVYFSQKARKTFFLARNCLEAIVKLCKAGLSVPNPNRPDSPFKIVIIKDILTVNHIPAVNVQPNIEDVLKKRVLNDWLDLTKFYEDKDLLEFCPLSQPKLLLYILSLSENLESSLNRKITKIILCDNDIKHLPKLDSLSHRDFKSIDLSNNKIQNIDDIVPLKDLPHLSWVRLDKNPLCCRFDSGFTYFLYVKTICKNLKILDNKRLCDDTFYNKHKTFLCDRKGFDFANQFLEQYFTYYDELNRPNIESYYSVNAMFSLTMREMSYRSLGWIESVREFRYRNRNLLDHQAGTQNKVFLFYGKAKVVEQLCSLSSTQHNPHAFDVDLMVYSKNQAIICVTGVFRVINHPLVYGFTRNFVLSSKDGKEWVITNDLLHVYVPFELKIGTKSNMPKWPTPNIASSFPVCNFNTDHMRALISTFESITGMEYEPSQKFLEKSNWDLELALKVFIDEHINNEIPDEAFNNERDKEQKEESDEDDVIITEDNVLPSIKTLLSGHSGQNKNLTKKNQDSVQNQLKPISQNSDKPIENYASGRTLKRRMARRKKALSLRAPQNELPKTS